MDENIKRKYGEDYSTKIFMERERERAGKNIRLLPCNTIIVGKERTNVNHQSQDSTKARMDTI